MCGDLLPLRNARSFFYAEAARKIQTELPPDPQRDQYRNEHAFSVALFMVTRFLLEEAQRIEHAERAERADIVPATVAQD